MARSLSSRLFGLLWGPADDEFEDGEPEATPRETAFVPPPVAGEPDPPATARRGSRFMRREDNVQELYSTRPRTEVRYPHSFDDAQELAEVLKQRAQLIVDLEGLDEKDRTRLVHFLYGVAYGVDGRSHRINELTFVFVPRHIELEPESPRRGTGSADPGFVPRFQVPR